MTSGTEMRDAAWYERQYNPRVTVADAGSVVASWPARAEATRRAHPPIADIPTGTHPRERVDLFRVPQARGTIAFIHGGYFRALSKFETSFVADGFLGAGLSVALLGYPLCPEVSLEDLVESVRRSFARLVADILTPEERAAVVVTGHSAGGYLTAALAATDWRERGLDGCPFDGAVSISGVFDLAPLVHTSMNEQIRLTPDRLAALDVTRAPQIVPVPFVAAVGGLETSEFHRQSRAFADAWSAPRPSVSDVRGANHFTVLDPLATPGTALNRAVTDLAEAAGAARAGRRAGRG